jgi:hypothetical protein
MLRTTIVALALAIVAVCPDLAGAVERAGPGAKAEAPTPEPRNSSPIYNGRNHQPTQNQLDALNKRDVTPQQAREVDRLFAQLMASSWNILARHPASH